jgi:peptidoglycan/xylan/chitin deacetylase (PgdA/CDA1 family)
MVGQFIASVDTSNKVVALTIDDAPSIHTPAILRLLQSHNAAVGPATLTVTNEQTWGFVYAMKWYQEKKSGEDGLKHA